MSVLSAYNKFEPTKVSEDDWIASPRGGNGTDVDRMLIKRRAEIEVIGQVNDAEASYSFEDWALVRLDGAYYWICTSGCSCPSPDEEWGVSFGPGTLAEARAAIGKDDYGMTSRQYGEFMAICDLVDDSIVRCGHDDCVAHPDTLAKACAASAVE